MKWDLFLSIRTLWDTQNVWRFRECLWDPVNMLRFYAIDHLEGIPHYYLWSAVPLKAIWITCILSHKAVYYIQNFIKILSVSCWYATERILEVAYVLRWKFSGRFYYTNDWKIIYDYWWTKLLDLQYHPDNTTVILVLNQTIFANHIQNKI